MSTIGSLNIWLNAQTANFTVGMAKAKAAMLELGHAMPSKKTLQFMEGMDESAWNKKMQGFAKAAAAIAAVKVALDGVTKGYRVFQANADLVASSNRPLEEQIQAAENLKQKTDELSVMGITFGKWAGEISGASRAFDQLADSEKNVARMQEKFKVQSANYKSLHDFASGINKQADQVLLSDFERYISDMDEKRKQLEKMASAASKDEATQQAIMQPGREALDRLELARAQAIAEEKKKIETGLLQTKVKLLGQFAVAERMAFIQSLRDRADAMNSMSPGTGDAFLSGPAGTMMKEFDLRGLLQMREELQTQVATFGMTAAAAAMYKAALAGMDPAHKAEAAAIAAENDALQKQLDHLDAVKSSADLLKNLKDQVNTFGMSDIEKQIAGFKDQGINTTELERQAAKVKQLENMKQVLDSLKTPMDKYTEQVQMLDDLYADAALTADEYQRALMLAFNNSGMGNFGRTATTMTREYSLNIPAESKIDTGELMKQSLAEARRQSRTQERIASAVESGNVVVTDIA